MGQIMAILEKKYGMDIPEADSGVAHKELWDRMENCRKQQGTGQVISALEGGISRPEGAEAPLVAAHRSLS